MNDLFHLQLFAEGEGAVEAPLAPGADGAEGPGVVPAEDPQAMSFRTHIQGLEAQGESMKALFPGFDLRQELRNPAFARMTAPDVGISVEDAYYALHRSEIQAAAMQVTAQKTAQMISEAIRSGSLRPAENGASGQAATVSTFDYRSASKEQRTALKKRIRETGAKGMRLFPDGSVGR